MKPGFLYVLHSGNLYGTERMALATLDGLRDRLEPVLFAPPGPALEEAGRLDIPAVAFRGAPDLAIRVRPWIAHHRRIAFAATGVSHSLIFLAWNRLYRRRNVHLHLVHGGTDERESYGRKRLLNGTGVRFVAVSEFVRERLLAHGVTETDIEVCENFLPDRQIAAAPRRPAFREGVRNVVVVSRVDPIKRIDLLFDCLDRHPALERLDFRICGTGWDLEVLRARAEKDHPNVVFEGFSDRVPQILAESDLLLHLCPCEPFGLAILEAMAAGVPVLVPDTGGAASLIEPGVSGFQFRAGDADDLGTVLEEVAGLAPASLDRIVAAADARLRERYSSKAGLERYARLFEELTDD
ncbi:glycosyltransferase family 4 protein [Methylococcus capsulatus]|uniref:glycosyltransferase family 4 protein n=1 Tax=Methylococcus capsulatus TaxID=414 RepID=UPI001C52C969|nr:glycosyltransferase family 4 protein [Methylococcus capsulatus]QXP87874.1 glycosyltransferase family 4 protein [Methylococcus capsulatus]QXP92386.1 glycosyltransferase family 4 protein [Methylococcus capsulatus]UQN12896.1 glycosyltransferase family 4 protein [Methylococcus capsulatus]